MDTTLQNTQIGPGTTPVQNQVAGTSQTIAPKTPLVTNLPETTNVNANALGTQPLNVPTKTPSSTPPVTENLADSVIKATEVADTEAQKTAKGISQTVFDLIPELKGQTQALATAQEQAGVNRIKQELQGINSQILKKQAEIQQDDITLISQMRAEERRDTLRPFAQQGQAKLAGDAAIMRALKTSEIGVLNAQVLAKQGDIALAMETAKQAVDAKYAPIREEIEIGQAQLQALAPILSRDEKKQARAQEIKGQLAMKEIDKVANLQKDALANAIQNNAPQSILDRISKARTIEEITSVGSQYLVSPNDRLDRALKSAQLAKINKEIGTKTGTVSSMTTEQKKKLINTDPVGYFSEVIKEADVKGSTGLESLLGVIQGAKEFADYGTEKGRFKGAAPVKATPGFAKGEEQLTTQGFIGAINLKVEQWASGASLTEEQTKKVKKLTPDKNDTDKQIKTKLNALTNFMISQGKSSLANQGVKVEIPEVDLFSVKTVQTPTDVTSYLDVVEESMKSGTSVYGAYGI